MNKNKILPGGGKNLTGGGKWGWRGREVGGEGEGSGDWVPPCPPPPPTYLKSHIFLVSSSSVSAKLALISPFDCLNKSRDVLVKHKCPGAHAIHQC